MGGSKRFLNIVGHRPNPVPGPVSELNGPSASPAWANHWVYCPHRVFRAQAFKISVTAHGNPGRISSMVTPRSYQGMIIEIWLYEINQYLFPQSGKFHIDNTG
jgi:hypothetical protein